MSLRSLFLGLSLICSIEVVLASSPSSSDLEDEFVEVSLVNVDAEALFPQSFTPEQMQCFFDRKPAAHSRKMKIVDCDEYGHPYQTEISIPIGTLSVDEKFHKDVAPNTLQFLTGTAASYASKIKFTKAVDVQNGELNGIYEYISSYESLYGLAGYAGVLSFPVKLQLDPSYTILNTNNLSGRCRIFNIRESILGDRDFISPACQLDPANKLIPNASLYGVFNTDEKFVRQTNSGMHRLPLNTKTWLLLLEQLRYGQLHKLEESERDQIADKLYKNLLLRFGFDENNMSLDNFVTCILSLRHDILGCLGLDEKDIPEIRQEHIVKMTEGKVLFLAPEKGSKLIPVDKEPGQNNNNV